MLKWLEEFDLKTNGPVRPAIEGCIRYSRSKSNLIVDFSIRMARLVLLLSLNIPFVGLPRWLKPALYLTPRSIV